MGNGSLVIYNASAGSGKTYALTSVYLNHIFKSRHNYRKILAVTFTNKATAEMKSRILENLYRLGSGMESGYLSELTADLNKSEGWIRTEAQEILNTILHDYSRFSITTIDSFFQRILRAFTREVGLHSGFSIEMENERILAAAVRQMIRSAAADAQMRNWLTSYALANIEEEKTWNLQNSIMKLSNELFNEKFRMLPAEERSLLGNKKHLGEYINELRTLIAGAEKQLKTFGQQAETFFTHYGLTDNMFYQKSRGIPRFVKTLLAGEMVKPNSYTLAITENPPKWSSGEPSGALQLATGAGLEKLLTGAINFIDTNITTCKSAEAILSNIYSLGILSDISHNVHIITSDENRFLLAETGDVISQITGHDQTGFIYEKAGTRFTNFMIDEFQDTSVIQWNNFKPLIDNSMAEGNDNLIVGDVKQSIYRWRNSDWRILGLALRNTTGNTRIVNKTLNVNWRSCDRIINFNNTLFTLIPAIIDKTFEPFDLPVSFSNLYSEAVQQHAGKQNGGYVKIEFIDRTENRTWKQLVLEKIPETIGRFIQNGYRPSDIGIIVRNKKEGAQILKTIIEYNNLFADLRQFGSFAAMSDDSLELGSFPALRFIIAVLKTAADPNDTISKAAMLKFYLLATGDSRAGSIQLENGFDTAAGQYLPHGYRKIITSIGGMPLFEATEKIIDFFGIAGKTWNVAPLNTFQDAVLAHASSTQGSAATFIEWWETSGHTKTIAMPANLNAIRILTIHKSKGLEFKAVILPFLSWNLDHIASKAPVIWVKPQYEPLNKIAIAPVKYSKVLEQTIFAADYTAEKYSSYLDNLNLLYVALTRAREAICAFTEQNPRTGASVSSLLLKAITEDRTNTSGDQLNLTAHYNPQTATLEYGTITPQTATHETQAGTIPATYSVTNTTSALKLRFEGENYFNPETTHTNEKINYGKIMHQVFEGIDTADDIDNTLRKLALEGKIPESQTHEIAQRIKTLISAPETSQWFSPAATVLREAAILIPGGQTKRPDRIVINNNTATIIDFKFGQPNNSHIRQLAQYRDLIVQMGYTPVHAKIWYVDTNTITTL